MADTNPTETQDPSAATAAPAKGSALMRINIFLFLLSVVIGECVMACFFMPSPSEAAAAQAVKQETPAKKEKEKEKEEESKPEDKKVEQVEIDLGEFTVTSFQPASNSTLRIDFHLYGVIRTEDEKAFSAAIEENKHRFRDQVLTIVRSAELVDLTDASLSLMKRKLLDKTNRMLGKPLVESMIISDFSFIEQ